MYSTQSVANNNMYVAETCMSLTQQQSMNYHGLQQSMGQQQGQQHQKPTQSKGKKPYVKITEQPAGKALRFRYECEGRSAGSIPGVNSTPENKTYPTIEIVGYKGRAVVVVSCVTKDPPYRPHPHNLVGKEGCKKGVCTVEVNTDTMRAVFSNLGIQCVKKKDIDAALKAREAIRVDPFKTGFEHRCQPSSIDLNSVRLCFQVFIESKQSGRFTDPLSPVLSDPIFDKKAMSDLVISQLCSCSTTVLGNTQIILLCEKVSKDDIMVRFFEEKDGKTWEAYGEFQQTDVHKQTAISFKTPRYHTIDITEPAKVFIQLKRPSDGVTSEPLPFEYRPLDADPDFLRRKRKKTNDDTRYLLMQKNHHQQPNTSHDQKVQNNTVSWKSRVSPSVKIEPRDATPSNNYRNPFEMVGTPQQHNMQPAHLMSTHMTSAQCGYNQLQQPPRSMQHQQQQQQQIYNNAMMGSTHAINLHQTNPFVAQNYMNIENPVDNRTSPSTAVQPTWNISPDNMHQQQTMQQQQQYMEEQQQQYQHQPPTPTNMHEEQNNLQNTTQTISGGADGRNNNAEKGPTVSSLFTLESGQLMHLDSDVQLESDDFRISSLSIST